MITLVIGLAASVFGLLVLSIERRAPQVGNRNVMTYNKVWKQVVGAFWLFPVVIAIVALIFPPDAGERWIPPAIIAGACALNLAMTLEVFRRRIELDESGISQQSAWSQPLTIAWKDVRNVAWRWTSEVEVQAARGRKVRVSLYLTGMVTFAEALKSRLGHLPCVAAIVTRIRTQIP